MRSVPSFSLVRICKSPISLSLCQSFVFFFQATHSGGHLNIILTSALHVVATCFVMMKQYALKAGSGDSYLRHAKCSTFKYSQSHICIYTQNLCVECTCNNNRVSPHARTIIPGAQRTHNMHARIHISQTHFAVQLNYRHVTGTPFVVVVVIIVLSVGRWSVGTPSNLMASHDSRDTEESP